MYGLSTKGESKRANKYNMDRVSIQLKRNI